MNSGPHRPFILTVTYLFSFIDIFMYKNDVYERWALTIFFGTTLFLEINLLKVCLKHLDGTEYRGKNVLAVSVQHVRVIVKHSFHRVSI